MKIWWHLFWFVLFLAENWIQWKLLLICPLAETLSVCGQQRNNCLNLKLHCSFLTLYTSTCEVFVIQQLNQYLDNKWLPFKINHSGLCLNLNSIQFGHFLGLAMLSSHLLSSSLCRGTELTPDFALENFRSSGGLIWGTTTFLWDWLN